MITIITLDELKERLAAQFDETSILEFLEVDSYQLVNVFSELVEDKFDYLVGELEGLEDDKP